MGGVAVPPPRVQIQMTVFTDDARRACAPGRLRFQESISRGTILWPRYPADCYLDILQDPQCMAGKKV
jgi:hypothetical protein